MMIYLSIFIILGYAVNALMDGIAFSKSPQGRDLNLLWHLAKYFWVGTILVTGALLYIQISEKNYLGILIWGGAAFIIGFILWEVTYRLYRKIDWPDWA